MLYHFDGEHMITIAFDLNIVAKPLKRARHSSRNGFVRTYYTKKDTQEMESLEFAIINALTPKDKITIADTIKTDKNGISIALELKYHMPIPKSLSKVKRNALIGKPHIVKPDVDNLLKNFLDRGNGILWEDDKIISSVMVSKCYDEVPKISVLIKYNIK